jgi:hypothetical protein
MLSNIDPFLLVCGAIILVLVIAIVLGTYHHVYKAKFKPKFIQFSDGSLQMEFSEFGGVQTTRTERFYKQYKIGMQITHNGKNYEIVQFKEICNPSVIRTDLKIVAYLEEVQ